MTEKEKQEIRRYLNVIKRAVSLVEGILENNDDGLLESMVGQEQQPPPIFTAHAAAPEPKPVTPNVVFKKNPEPKPEVSMEATEMKAHKLARKKHIGELMAIDCWPEAIPAMLAKKEPSEREKQKRANMVLDMMIDREVKGLNFLDFGCGEGYVAEQMAQKGVKKSTGYDIELQKGWKDFQHAKFTHVYNELDRRSFDIIMLYDVLDHTEDPEGVMNQVRNLIKPGGAVYVRCHPWTSKHAMHLHTLTPELNRAYLHMFLSYEELFELAQQAPMFTRREKNPLEAYHWWFKDFDIKRERKLEEDVSEFFTVPAFKDLLKSEQKVEDMQNLLSLMRIQFVDYLLIAHK